MTRDATHLRPPTLPFSCAYMLLSSSWLISESVCEIVGKAEKAKECVAGARRDDERHIICVYPCMRVCMCASCCARASLFAFAYLLCFQARTHTHTHTSSSSHPYLVSRTLAHRAHVDTDTDMHALRAFPPLSSFLAGPSLLLGTGVHERCWPAVVNYPTPFHPILLSPSRRLHLRVGRLG